jgi:hypothetical protein
MREHDGAVMRVAAPARRPRARPRPAAAEDHEAVMFDTPEADSILSAMQVFPPDNPWNQDISTRPSTRIPRA